jgi:hypothetical protein
MLPLYLAAAGALAQTPLNEYTRTPFGHVLSHCVHEVPSGSNVFEIEGGGGTVVQPPYEPSYVIPKCIGAAGSPVLRRAGNSSLPPNYDGWLQYTVLNVDWVGANQSFDAFTSVMSVPDMPKQQPDMLYFFPGLQNQDWIPKVDPEPTFQNPFDIIQPVLQFPGSGFHNGWELKSWYVTIHAGAIFSKPITGIKAGDAILCNMTRTGPMSWAVTGALRSDPTKATTQQARNERLREQPWAYAAVAECYGCRGCETYPKTPITFTANRLWASGRELHVNGSQWGINSKPALKLECNEATHVEQNGDTTISFQ